MGRRRLVRPSTDTSPGMLGILGRHYPAASERNAAIATVRAIPDDARTSDDWWVLGEFLVYDGLLEENDALVNEGILALSRGAALPSPSAACLLDLAWLQLHKGLDAMALLHLERAVALAPASRDAWSFLGIARMGTQDRSGAFSAFERAVALPSAQEFDHDMLRRLGTDEPLNMLRREVVLGKAFVDLIGTGQYASDEDGKVARFFLKLSLKTSPDDVDLLYGVGYVEYLLRRYKEAARILEPLAMGPARHADACTLLGLIARHTSGDVDAELSWYARALEVDSGHMLALVNTAQRLHERREFHAARPLLARALRGDSSSEYYPIALDLMANSVAEIECDYEQEIYLHAQAIQAAPDRPLFKGNLIVALLSVGRIKDARDCFRRHREQLRRHPDPEVLRALVDTYSRDGADPRFYLSAIEHLKPTMGDRGVGPLVQKAWAQRHQLPADDDIRLGFYQDLGLHAGRAQLKEIALEIWTAGARLKGGEELHGNRAVELSDLGRFEEAEAACALMPPSASRRNTIRGNIRRKSGNLEAAVAAYTDALHSDRGFALPIRNGLDCIDAISRPDLAEPFVAILRSGAIRAPERQLLLGRALLLVGRPREAAAELLSVLMRSGQWVSPESLFQEAESDPTVLTAPSTEPYWCLVLALLRAGRVSEAMDAGRAVLSWPRWSSGDWRVIAAEAQRRLGDHVGSEATLASITDQPPVLLTRALNCLDTGRIGSAKDLALRALTHVPGPEHFTHALGRPDALAHVVLARVDQENGHLSACLQRAQRAIELDAACIDAHVTACLAYRACGARDHEIATARKGLSASPHAPALVSHLVEALVDTDRLGEAAEALEDNRDGLAQHDQDGLGYRLGELLAGARLASTAQAEQAADQWHWIDGAPAAIQPWLRGACLSTSHIHALKVAHVMYCAKVAEWMLTERLMEPFRISLRGQSLGDEKQFDRLLEYLSGRTATPPTLGSVGYLLRAAHKTPQRYDAEVVRHFRTFVSNLEYRSARNLLQPDFVAAVNRLATARNQSAHLGEPEDDEALGSVEIVVKNGAPGILFESLGLSV
jgi:tetratricopeptide (TPR) repeat protein